jgi:hypothetical protein
MTIRFARMATAAAPCGDIALGPSTDAWAAPSTARAPTIGLPHSYGDADVGLARENGLDIARDRWVQPKSTE